MLNMRNRSECIRYLSLITICATLISCKVGPNYHPPEYDMPNAWHEVKPVSATAATAKPEEKPQPAQLDKQALAEMEWWKQFNDPALDDLIAKGLSQNYDLKIAQAHIREARAQLSQARSALLPEVDIGGTAEREANLIAFGNTTFPKPFNLFQAGFDASWELDFFGGKRRAFEAFSDLFGASKADLAGIRISVLAEIARTYINVRAYQAQVAIASDGVKEEEQNVKIHEELYKAGSTSETDLIHARTSLAQTHSQLLAYQNLLATSEYALDLLLAEKPGTSHTLLADVKPIPVANKDIMLAAPAEVMANRPDIHAAERRLAASTAEIGVAKSELFPSVTLSGFFGLFSPTTNTLLNARSKAWSESAAINWPILNFGRVSADINLAREEHKESLDVYKKAILAALVDVESSLSAYNKQEDTRTILDKSVADNQQGLDIANTRYKSGVASLSEVLDAQKTLYTARSQAANATAAAGQGFIAVYKSLGGGWKTKPETVAAAEKALSPAPASPAVQSQPANVHQAKTISATATADSAKK